MAKQTQQDWAHTNTRLDKEGLAFSKGIVLLSLLLFIIVLIIVINQEPDQNMSYMATVYTAALAAAGGMAITAIVWYLKKTHVSYTTRVQAGLYKQVLGWELLYKKDLMALQHELKLTDAEMSKIENSEMSAKSILNGAFSDVNSNIKSSVAEGTATVKKEVL